MGVFCADADDARNGWRDSRHIVPDRRRDQRRVLAMIINLARRNVTSTGVESASAPNGRLTGGVTQHASESVSGRRSNAVAGLAPIVAGIIALLLTKRPLCNGNTREGEQE